MTVDLLSVFPFFLSLIHTHISICHSVGSSVRSFVLYVFPSFCLYLTPRYLSIYLSICLSVYLSVYFSVCLSVGTSIYNLSIHRSVGSSIRLFVRFICLPFLSLNSPTYIYQSIFLCIYLSVSLPVYLHVCLFLCLSTTNQSSVRRFVRPSVCLFVCSIYLSSLFLSLLHPRYLSI